MTDRDTLLEIVNDSLYNIDLDPNRPMELSNNRIRTFKNCPAGYLYNYVILSKIESEYSLKVAGKGVLFHHLAEHDFNRKELNQGLHEVEDQIKSNIEDYISYTKGLPYATEKYESEVELRHKISKNLTFMGIIDRIYETSPIKVVDWKTTNFQANVSNDREQGKGYVYLVHKNRKVDPSDIECIIEYVALEEPYTYNFSKSDMLHFENSVKMVHNRIVKTEEDFIKTKSLKNIKHMRGNCNFCIMKGICRAYLLLINPVDGIDNISHMTTEEIASDFYKFDDAYNTNKARADILKAALLERYNAGDTSVLDHVGVTPGKKLTYYDTKDVIKVILDKSTNVAKRVEFADMIDWGSLHKVLVDEISAFLPNTMSASNIPQKIRSRVKFRTARGAAYVRKKT